MTSSLQITLDSSAWPPPRPFDIWWTLDKTYTFNTERLCLRPLTVADAPSLYIALSDPEVVRYWSTPPHQDVEQTKSMLIDYLSGSRSTMWAITVPPEDAALGWVTLIHVREGVKELGYILQRQAWGQGFATEAVAEVIAHAFDVLGAHRVAADIDPRNAASTRMMQKLGFSKEGLLRENWLVAEEYCDSVIYGLLKRDRKDAQLKPSAHEDR